jgi:hypothetical protein
MIGCCNRSCSKSSIDIGDSTPFRERYLAYRRSSPCTTAWTFKDLEHLLCTIVEFQGFPISIDLFLDAVDESEKSWQVVQMLHQKILSKVASNVVLKVIVACRPMVGFDEIPHAREIRLESHNSQEIDNLIDQRMKEIQKKLVRLSDKRDLAKARRRSAED